MSSLQKRLATLDKLVAIGVGAVHIGRRRQVGAEEQPGSLLVEGQHGHVVGVEVERDAGPLADRFGRQNVIEMGVRDEHARHLIRADADLS